MTTIFTEIAGDVATSGVIGTADTLLASSATAGEASTLSTITVSNIGASPQTFSLCRSATSSFDNAGYIVKEADLDPGEVWSFTIGMTLTTARRYLLVSGSSTDVVAGYSGVLKTEVP